MTELNELSVTIGELRADVKSNRVAMERIEERLAEISDHVVSKHAKITDELTKLKIDNAKHATIISAIVAGVVLFGKQLLLTFAGKL